MPIRDAIPRWNYYLGSAGPLPVRLDRDRRADKELSLRLELKGRIGSRMNCRAFINGVLAALGGKIAPGLSVQKLLNNIMSATREEGVTDLKKGVYEEVSDNTIRISVEGMAPHTYDWGRGTFRYYGDKLSVYLHAAFHLSSSAAPNEQISDSDLYNAVAPLVGLTQRTVLFEEQKSSIVGAAFAAACGSGRTVQPGGRR